MSDRIIFPSEEGGIVIVNPCLDCGLTIEEIASKDVPAGVPYLIVSETNFPKDYLFFSAWEADFSNPHGYGIGHEAWFRSRP